MQACYHSVKYMVALHNSISGYFDVWGGGGGGFSVYTLTIYLTISKS